MTFKRENVILTVIEMEIFPGVKFQLKLLNLNTWGSYIVIRPEYNPYTVIHTNAFGGNIP